MPKQAAAEIVALETRIAKAQWSKVQNRDADKTYNKMGLAELAKLAPGFDWQLYFQTIGVEGRQGSRRRAAVATWRRWPSCSTKSRWRPGRSG